MKPATLRWFLPSGGACALLLLVAAGVPVKGQVTGVQTPPLAIQSMSGRDLFDFYCASCHGRDGKGDGPVAPLLKTRPADLTTLAGRYGGRFPTALVESRVTNGDAVSTGAHGSTDMPVWGPIFRALDPRDTMNKVRISNIVGHVESIQAK